MNRSTGSTASLLTCVFAAIAAAEPVTIVDKAPPGAEFAVVSASAIAGEVTPPGATPIRMTGTSAIGYFERILPVAAKDADHKSLRIYDRLDFKKTAGDRTDESTLRPAVRRVVFMKRGHAKVPFSPDGPLQWSEIDVLRTDFVIPALAGLLPEKPVEIGATWKAGTAAVVELTDLEKIDKGSLDCTFDKVVTAGPRKLAQVSFAGTVEGVNEDGPTRQSLKGKVLVDLGAECITYLEVEGEHHLLDGDGKPAGVVKGKLELTRSPTKSHPAFAESALKGVGLDPSEENTRLLYDEEETGVRFIHPRQWRVVRTTGRQITLDEAAGSGLLITLEPAATTPTATQFAKEVVKELKDRQAKLLSSDPPKSVADGVEMFHYDAEIGGDKTTMAYAVVKRDLGGATLAMSIPTAHRAERLKELERLAQSFAVTRRLDGK